MRHKIIKYKLVIFAVFLIAFCYIYAYAVGREYSCRFEFFADELENNTPVVYFEDGSDDCVDIIETRVEEGGSFYVKVRSKTPGKVYLAAKAGEHTSSLITIYVHPSGIITEQDYFGYITGGEVIRIFIVLYVAVVLAELIYKYRKAVKENIYTYDNILLFGLIVFVAFLLLSQILSCITESKLGLYILFCNILTLTESFAFLTFPVAFISAILTTLSNVQLLRKEGRSWRNTLGIILGVILCIATLTPVAISTGLERSRWEWFDVHRWTGIGRFIGMFIEYTAGIIVSYFEFILIGSIVLGIKAARHIPAFDKDYIVINGCQIRKDGTVTKLLQSRADRAIEFAAMQKKATGKDIIFVPSGGKGSDEVISEAESISNYLISQGIPESSIIPENKSTTTLENFKYSAEIIKEKGPADAKVAFSTTNYHVFRSGMLASRAGIRAEGIGSPTKSYFWVNAFIRELVATIVYERKKHFLVLTFLMLINIAVVLMTYFSNVVLSFD